MTDKYFLLYADGETIRELTYEEYYQKSKQHKKSILVAVRNWGIAVSEGQKDVFVRKDQLLRVLAEAKWIKKET